MKAGLAYALSAYVAWGFMPIYFKQVALVPPLLVLGHRVIWSVAFLGVLISVGSRWGEFIGVMRQRRTMAMLSISTALLAVNWGTFIYAVSTKRIVEGSLGYFITPLASAALGVGVLKERLRGAQWIAVLIAAVGVVVITIERGSLPCIALAIMLSWSGYSLVRKVTAVGPLVGVAVETLLLLPAATVYVIWATRPGGFEPSGYEWTMLLLAGVVTAFPLLWFTAAARRLKLSTVGFLQYLTPTCQFLLGVLVYKERFSWSNAAGFGLIWLALVVFSIDSLRTYQTTMTVAPEV